MFHDERINAECGKMYRRGILLATLLTALSGCLRALLLYRFNNLNVRYLSLEFIVVISGALILLTGALLFIRDSDERVMFNKYKYYCNAGRLFLLVLVIACVISMQPTFVYGNDFDIPKRYSAIFLGFGCVYYFFHLRLKNISVNYSFIEDDHYHKKVFMYMAKAIGLLLAALMIVSVITDLFLNLEFYKTGFIIFNAISLIFRYCPTIVVGYALGYLYISWLEHSSYHHPNGKNVKNERLIAVIVALTVQILLFLLILFGYELLFNIISEKSHLEGIGNLIGKVIKKSLRNLNTLTIGAFVLVSLGICSLLPQIKSKSKRLVLAIKCYVVWYAGTLLFSCFMDFAEWNYLIAPAYVTKLSGVRRLIAQLPILFDLAFSWVMIYGLIKDLGWSKRFMIAPIAQTLLLPLTWQLSVYVQNQNLYVMPCVVSLQSILTFATLIPIVVILNRSSREETETMALEVAAQIE